MQCLWLKTGSWGQSISLFALMVPGVGSAPVPPPCRSAAPVGGGADKCQLCCHPLQPEELGSWCLPRQGVACREAAGGCCGAVKLWGLSSALRGH